MTGATARRAGTKARGASRPPPTFGGRRGKRERHIQDADSDEGGTMALTVKKITLWRGKVDNRPGTLAEVLAPAATARTDLKVVMGYRERGEAQAVIELFPVGGKKLTTAMASAG